MKSRNLLPAVFLVVFTMIATGSFAQQTDAKKAQTQINDDQVKTDAERNAKRQKEADALDQEYKAKAKETNRINKDADNAAKQAKKSARLEKKAQKARERAEKQAQKANKAAIKSDDN